MFERPVRMWCPDCGTRIMIVRTAPFRCIILDVEEHPAGDVAMDQVRDGWVARRLSTEELYAHRGRRYAAHVATCIPVEQPERASS